MNNAFVFHEQVADGSATQHVIPDLPLVTIGSDASNRIVLSGAGVSAFHAVLMHEDDGGVVICDQGSVAGVQVNGERVEERPLRHGDMVSIGGCVMRFEDAAAVTALPPPAAPLVEEPPHHIWTDDTPEEPEPQFKREGLVALLLLLLLGGAGTYDWWMEKKKEATAVADAPPASLAPSAEPDGSPMAAAAPPAPASVKADGKNMRSQEPAGDKSEKKAIATPKASHQSSSPPPTPPGSLSTPAATEPRPLSVRVWELVSRSSSGDGGQPLPPLPGDDGRIARLDTTFDEAVEKEVMAGWRQAVGQLRGQYQQALEREFAALQQQPGEVDGMTDFKREIELVKSGGEVASGVATEPARLSQLRHTFLLEAAKLEMKREGQTCFLYDSYCRGLGKYVADLQLAGDQEAARSVAELRRAIEQGRIPQHAPVTVVSEPAGAHEDLASRLRGTRWTFEMPLGASLGTIDFYEDSARGSFGLRGLWQVKGPNTIVWQNHVLKFDAGFLRFTGWWVDPVEKRQGKRVVSGPTAP